MHISVLLDEVVEWLNPQPGQFHVDGTLGGGGHTERLLQAVGETGRVLAGDLDQAALDKAEERFAGRCLALTHANYAELPEIIQRESMGLIDGVVLDIGLSSDQLDDHERGFSFTADGELDLRFDVSSGEPAWRLLQRLSESDIADLIYEYGEERFSRRIARRIVEARRGDPVRTAPQLAAICRASYPRSKAQRIDPATRSFQALRIAVNRELESLKLALQRFPRIMKPGARIAIISFHSLEDRLVKHAFRDQPEWHALTTKPIRPSDAELERNTRSRSAKMRVAELVPAGGM